jgi:hypothetical protein
LDHFGAVTYIYIYIKIGLEHDDDTKQCPKETAATIGVDPIAKSFRNREVEARHGNEPFF